MKLESFFSQEARKRRFAVALRYFAFFSQITTCLIVAGCSKNLDDVELVRETNQKEADGDGKTAPKQEGKSKNARNGEELAGKNVTHFTQGKQSDGGGKTAPKHMVKSRKRTKNKKNRSHEAIIRAVANKMIVKAEEASLASQEASLTSLETLRRSEATSGQGKSENNTYNAPHNEKTESTWEPLSECDDENFDSNTLRANAQQILLKIEKQQEHRKTENRRSKRDRTNIW